MNRFKTELRSLCFRNLVVVLQPEFQEPIKIDQFDMDGPVTSFATRLFGEASRGNE